jgi:hypothetical protein
VIGHRDLFQPDVVRGDDRGEVNASFRNDVMRFSLIFRCQDCAFQCADGRCSLAWPNAALREPPLSAIEIVGADRIPLFCKAFEPDDG